VKYRLVSLGRLKPGSNEQQALQSLIKMTKLPELTVRKKLLAGKQASLVTSEDVTKVAAAKGKFEAIGLMVEVVEVPDPPKTEAEPVANGSKTKKAKKPRKTKPAKTKGSGVSIGTLFKRVALTMVVVLLLVAGTVGGLWYWLFMAKTDVDALESALITPNTAATLNVDLAQVGKLETLVRTNLTDLLAQTESPHIVTDVLQLTAREDFHADQAYVSVIAQGGDAPVDVVTVVTGQFPVESWHGALSRYYALQTLPSGLIEMSPTEPVANEQCPAEVKDSAKPMFAKLSTNRVVIAANEETIQRFEARLSAGVTQHPALAQWQEYRKSKLVSAMVFSPKNSTEALPGMMGMVGAQFVKTLPTVSGAAVSTKVDIANRGVRFNASLFSTDAAWNAEWADKANEWLATTRADSNVTSQAFATVLQNLTFQHTPQALDVDWPVNYKLIGELQHSVQNSLASALGGTMSIDGSQTTEIDETPIIYNLPISLAKLPQFEVPSYGGKPLFVNGAFAADVNNVSMNDDGFLELAVEAKAALPEFDGSDTLGELMRYSMMVNSITNGQGESLIRDELCDTSRNIYGAKNHEPETQGTAFFEQASTTKRVRLNEGTNVSDIQQVTGTYSLQYPINVQKFSLPMRAGETIEHAGLQFELISLSDHSARYKLAGEEDRLMEVRALNAQGQVLRQSWSSSFGKMKDQTYQGTVAALEVYIAGGFDEVSMPFSMENIFVREGEEDDAAHPFTLSYTTVQRAKWNKYQFVDMRLVRPKPEEWTYGENPRRAVATKAWPGFKLFVTHEPTGWNANPDAHFNLPLWIELYASMSSLSYTLDNGENKTEYVPVRFPYQISEQAPALIESQAVRQQPFGLVNFKFNAGYEEDQAFGNLKGKLTVRMPQKLAQQDAPFNDLWREKNINGIQVKLDNVSRGGLAGYHFEIRGDLENLIAVHGVNDYNQRIAPSSLNYQDGGYWTVTVPFRDNLNSLRVITAIEQDVFELPFDFK
jgi:hypothetical protein